ncbi:hypothetical protein CA12_32350 [Alienimonas californiensis]|uniref:Glycosyltransferase RgtA/B/C/D-like domain-containing protein n=1 Tax=Alienimonas californiensis TaxID=2527989 RepID=A0A517PCL3_9PLAN|nr:hypothetical protein CA12_32350 [Alienimonas californiensis]
MNSRVAPVVACVVTAGLLAATLATTAARPLYHADLWAHLAYGRHIRATGEVPATEPLMPLSAGEPFVNFAWLAGVFGSWLYDLAGPEGLRLAGGLLTALAVGGVGPAARRRARAPWAGWIAGAAFLFVAWFQLFAFPPWSAPLGPQMLRPQTLGVVLFAALLAATPIPRRPGWRWALLPLVFLLWTNLHGSWPLGLVWLAADLLNRIGRLGPAAWRSGRMRRAAGLVALCAAACCVNPLGPWAYVEALTFGGHPNLADVIEWRPLTWEMNQGRAFFLAAALLAVVARLSPRRIGWGEALVLVGFALAACRTSRWLLWWAGPAALFLGVHVAAIVQARWPQALRATRCRGSSWAWAAGLVLGVALSPPSWNLARGERATADSLAFGTPVRAAAYLRAHPPAAQLFHAHAFGDFLLVAGPSDVAIFVGSHAHLIPPQVWNDARALSTAAPGWEDRLELYGVTTLMLSPREQPALLVAARRSSRWRQVYGDQTAVIFERVTPPPRIDEAGPVTAAPTAAGPADAPAAGGGRRSPPPPRTP